VECSLRFLSYHLLFSSSFPVLSRFILSIPFVLLRSCHRFMFVRHFLFHLVSFIVLSYFTFPLHRSWSIIISFLVSSCALRLFAKIFSVALFRSVFRLSECILVIYLILKTCILSYSLLRDLLYSILYFLHSLFL
jgi:hypothetical protein